MRARSEERRGTIAVLAAVSLVAILGVVAMALDVGMLLDSKRRGQATADAAALAAAGDLYANWYANQGLDSPGTARASALSTAAANGYANDGAQSVVTVTFSPGKYQAGPNAGTTIPAGYVEVIVQYNQARGFSRLFGSGSLSVVARAAARGTRKASTVGMLLLDPSASGALSNNGTPGVKVDGSVIVNSTNSSAALAKGNGGLTSDELDVSGNYSTTGTAYFSATTIKTGVAATADFLSYVPTPDPTKIDNYGNSGTMTVRSSSALSPSSGQTLQPGVYVGGISFGGQVSVTLAPGIYYMQGGGLSMTAGASLTGSGVMIYNGPDPTSGATGTINLAGQSSVTLSPPTSGPYYGMTIFQARSSTQTVTLTGGGTWNLTGTVYAAGGQVTLNGSSGGTLGSQFVAGTMSLVGTTAFKDINPALGYRPKDIRLVE